MTIDEAKSLYAQRLKQEATTKNTKRKRKEKPLWETGKNETLTDGKSGMVVIIQEEEDALTLVSFKNDSTSQPTFQDLYTAVKLFVYRDEKGKEHLERMYIKGDREYAERKNFRYEDSDFTGKVWFEDFSDNFLRAYIYKDGKLIAKQVPLSEKEEEKNKRTLYTCSIVYETVVTTTSYYSITCFSSKECGPPKFMYNSTSTTLEVQYVSCYEDRSPSSGGGGSISANNLDIQDPGFWDWWNQINPLERDWLLANPEKAYKAYFNFKQAEVSSRQRFGGVNIKDQDGTNQNAYKHAYAAALHARTWGKTIAATIMNNHEGGPPPITGISSLYFTSQMDYLNNNLGLKIADLCGCDGDDLRDGIQKAIGKGEGRRYRVNNTTDGKLSPTTKDDLDND